MVRLWNLRGRPHVFQIPTLDPNFYLPARVAKMKATHARRWDDVVQRMINKHDDRADRNWNWPLYHKTTRLAGALGQRPRGFVLGIERPLANQFEPCVMLLLVESYRALHDHSKTSVFVWYISPAPTEYFINTLGLPPEHTPHRKRLMAIGMDVAVTHSYRCGLRGLIGLHAAREGGTRLLTCYESKKECGMRPLGGNQRLPSLVREIRRRFKKEHYYYHDEESAQAAYIRVSELTRRE